MSPASLLDERRRNADRITGNRNERLLRRRLQIEREPKRHHRRSKIFGRTIEDVELSDFPFDPRLTQGDGLIRIRHVEPPDRFRRVGPALRERRRNLKYIGEAQDKKKRIRKREVLVIVDVGRVQIELSGAVAEGESTVAEDVEDGVRHRNDVADIRTNATHAPADEARLRELILCRQTGHKAPKQQVLEQTNGVGNTVESFLPLLKKLSPMDARSDPSLLSPT